MTKTSKIVLKGAIVNCGLATALINMVTCYLTLAKVPMFLFTELSVNFLGTAIGCGLLCPLFGGIILKPLQKEPLNFEDKSSHVLARWVPNQILLGAVVIAMFSAILFWGMPVLLFKLLSVEFAIRRIFACFLLGLYSGVVATFAAYLGVHRAYYAKK